MIVSTRARLTPIAATAVTALVCVAPGAVPSVLRAIPLVAYVVLVPGHTMTRHVGFADPLVRWLVICVLGPATATACSEALAIARIWSPVAVVLLLGAISLLVAQVATSRPAETPPPAGGPR